MKNHRRSRRVILLITAWAIFATVAVMIPQGASAADRNQASGWASYDALFLTDMQTRITGSGAAPGVSPFGVDPVSSAVGRVAFDHSASPTRDEACDADEDGDATGTWKAEQSNGEDNFADIYLENRPGTLTGLRQTEPGYRTNVWVCTEIVGGLAAQWVDKREPIDSANPDNEVVLADDAVRWYEEAAENARAQVSGTLYEPGWEIWPAYRSRQIVGLPSWLYITDEAWEFHPSATAEDDEDGEVTVQAVARPVSSVWKFSDGETLSCPDRGDKWLPGLVDPPSCGREWEHTHEKVDLEVGLVYSVEWISSLATATIDLENLTVDLDTSPEPWRARANDGHSFSGSGTVNGPFREAVALRVGEAQAYGSTIGAREQLPPPESEPIAGKLHEPCGGFWGFVGCTLSSAIQILDAVASFLIPGFEEIKKFAQSCIEGGADFLSDIVEQIKGIPELIRNPFKAASDAWDAIKAMRTALAEDPVGFVLEFAVEGAELHRLEEPGGAFGWAGYMLCKKGAEWVMQILMSAVGAGAAALGAKLLRYMKKFKGRGNDRGDSGNDRDNDNRDDENNDDEENNRDCGCRGGTCRISNSFPAGTRVLMADGAHKPIELIHPGDHVISYNVDTSVWEPKLVVDQWSHPDRGPPATATLVDGSTVTATADHRFWVSTTEIWTELRHVQPGDGLLTPDGVVGVDHVTVGPAHPWTVWELTVTDNHNFTVSTSTVDVLTHNAPCDDDESDPNTVDDPNSRSGQENYEGDTSPVCIDSFPAGTNIVLADNTRLPIEEVEAGTRVVTFDTTEQVWRTQSVLAQWSRIDSGHMVELRLDDGTSIEATDHHLFWSVSENRWIEAESLEVGTLLLGRTRKPMVSSVAVHSQGTRVWELSVATDNNFVVDSGSSEVLVHNASCFESGTPEHKEARWEEYLDRDESDRKWGEDDYEAWSNTYEANQNRASAAAERMDNVAGELGLPEREVPISADELGDDFDSGRRIDMADTSTNPKTGFEHKSGDYTYRTPEIEAEILKDAALNKNGWDIEWVFDGTASEPLLKMLEDNGIPYTVNYGA